MVRKYALNKGYALVDYVATPTCMVKVASERRSKGGVTGNETSERTESRNREGQVNKISTMTSVGDLEESMFLSLHGLALA